MRFVTTHTGARIPALGMGTWRMGERPHARVAELRSLAAGLDLGLTLIDTAEMYGNGAAEELVGEAIRGRRDQVFVVTKVLPQNASRAGTLAAADRSLRRLGVEAIDLYLLHWPSRRPLAETLGAFEHLVAAGKIRHYGVSNFDADSLREALGGPGGAGVACNQVLYNLESRGPEWSLLPLCAERGVALMAYTPLASGALVRRRVLAAVAGRRGATPAQVALAWTLRHPAVVAVPKAADLGHIRDVAGALSVTLTGSDLAELDRAFPPPRKERPLETV